MTKIMQVGIMSSTLRFVLDMGPLVVFFLAYRFAGMMEATGALIGFTLLSLIITYAMEKRVAIMPLISGIAVAVLGGITLWLHDPWFIKIKPTIVNMVFASVLLVGVYYKKPMLKYVLESALQISEQGWLILSRRWGLFFIFLAMLNEIIWRHFSENFWVNFKVFGMLSLTILFTLCQIPLVRRHHVE